MEENEEVWVFDGIEWKLMLIMNEICTNYIKK